MRYCEISDFWRNPKSGKCVILSVKTWMKEAHMGWGIGCSVYFYCIKQWLQTMRCWGPLFSTQMKLEAATAWQQTLKWRWTRQIRYGYPYVPWKRLFATNICKKTDPRFVDSESWIMTKWRRLWHAKYWGGPRSIIDCIVGCDGERAITAFMRVS